MVPPSSDQVSRVWPYSGFCAALVVFAYVVLTLSDRPSHAVRLTTQVLKAVRTPQVFLPAVCPLPRSLATTYGISIDVSSSPYLDVSVQAVPPDTPILNFSASYLVMKPGEFPHSENPRINAYLQLPAAYRSLSRLSSAPSAKAFALRPSSLDQLMIFRSILSLLYSNCQRNNSLPFETVVSFFRSLLFRFRSYYSVLKVHLFEVPLQGPQN